MRNLMPAIMIAAMLAPAAVTRGAELRVGANDTVQSVLTGQKGARVTVRLRSGQELSGTVREINASVVHIGALAGKEFFDAVVPLGAIEAVLVRTKQ